MMWLVLVVVVAVAVLATALWMLGLSTGRQLSASSLAAAESTLSASVAVDAAANRALDQANQQLRDSLKMEPTLRSIEEQERMQTESANTTLAMVQRLDANFAMLVEHLSARGMTARKFPLQAGQSTSTRTEKETTNLPPPLPESAMPNAKPTPSSPAGPSSAPPTVTG